jgi:hypothetical protein
LPRPPCNYLQGLQCAAHWDLRTSSLGVQDCVAAVLAGKQGQLRGSGPACVVGAVASSSSAGRGPDCCRARALLSGAFLGQRMGRNHCPLKAALKLEEMCNLHKGRRRPALPRFSTGQRARERHHPCADVRGRAASRTRNASVCRRPSIEAGSAIESTSRPTVCGVLHADLRYRRDLFQSELSCHDAYLADRLDFDVVKPRNLQEITRTR